MYYIVLYSFYCIYNLILFIVAVYRTSWIYDLMYGYLSELKSIPNISLISFLGLNINILHDDIENFVSSFQNLTTLFFVFQPCLGPQPQC